MTIRVVPHHHAARVARETPRGSRGNVLAIVEHGLARLIGVRERCCIDVDDDLVPLARGTGVELMVERRLRDHPERIGFAAGRSWADRPRGPTAVTSRRLEIFRLAVHAAPATYYQLDLGCRAGLADVEQAFLGLRRSHAGERPDFRVRQLAAGQRLSDAWEVAERTGQ